MFHRLSFEVVDEGTKAGICRVKGEDWHRCFRIFCGVGALARRCDVRIKYASHLHPSCGWVPGAPPCIWTFLSSLGKREFFSILLERQLVKWSIGRFGRTKPLGRAEVG